MSAKEYVKAAASCAGVVLLLLAIWFASDVFLLMFAGILASIILRTVSDWLARLLHLRPSFALALTCTLLLTVTALFFLVIGARLSDEFDALKHEVPSAWHQLVAWLHKRQWSADLADRIQSSGLSYRHTAGTVLSAFSGLSAVIGGSVVVFFLTLYFAIDPQLYKGGFLKLLPKAAEARGDQVLCRCGGQLQKWLLGKLALMIFVGIATASGLWLLGIPLILSLAALAALLDFIPNIGPIISAIPAVLIAFTRGPSLAGEVILLYLGVQTIESYILQPLIQQRVVSLPPAITLVRQVLIGTIFGPLGLVLATPLTVVGLTLVQAIYIEDILKKRNPAPGS